MTIRSEVLPAIAYRYSRSLAATVEKTCKHQEFWTQVMLDENVATRDRLRASQLLGIAQGDFERTNRTR